MFTHILMRPCDCKCQSQYCPVCNGGLAFCIVCRGSEVELEANEGRCPGFQYPQYKILWAETRTIRGRFPS